VILRRHADVSEVEIPDVGANLALALWNKIECTRPLERDDRTLPVPESVNLGHTQFATHEKLINDLLRMRRNQKSRDGRGT
jgi:hypothetical protein